MDRGGNLARNVTQGNQQRQRAVDFAQSDNGVRVNSIRNSQAASQLGLREGDRITSINGRQIRSQQDLNDALGRVGRNDRDINVIVDHDHHDGHHHNEALAWTAFGLAAAGLLPWGGYGYGYGGYGGYGYGPYASYGWGPFWGPSYYSTYYGDDYGYSDYGYNNGSYVDGSYASAPEPPQYTTSSGGNGGFLGVILDERIPNMAVVRDVYEGSPAEDMGLRAGDTIWSVNGRQIRSSSQLTQEISHLPPGSEVDIRYSRPEVRDVEVTLDEQRR